MSMGKLFTQALEARSLFEQSLILEDEVLEGLSLKWAHACGHDSFHMQASDVPGLLASRGALSDAWHEGWQQARWYSGPEWITSLIKGRCLLRA